MTTLIREVYRTSRLLDFASTRELTAQIGHPAHKWPEVALKELVDNSLDAAEEAGVLPVINVRLDGAVLEVADEGPGIPDDVVTDILDFTVRVSSREAYAGPARGAQGNALKTILAMPFALDGTAGLVEVETRGILHQLRFSVDPIAQEPIVRHERLPSARAAGAAVRVHWPEGWLDPIELSNLLVDYALLNPHLRLTANLDTALRHDVRPTHPDWRRWRPSDPEPALWYDTERFARRIAAAIQHDRTRGERVRTVRDFAATFQGLSSTGRQKELLEQRGLRRATLEDAFVRPSGELDRDKTDELLTAMQSYATAVRPRRLGELGKAHINAAIGGEIVRFRRIEIDDPYAPILAEVALVYRGKGTRAVTVGINSSPALGGVDAVPYLTRCFQEARVELDDPVWFFIHIIGPGFRYTDRGKSRLALPLDATRQLYTEISAVLEPWRKYKKRKERDEKS
jgi:DNA topoisomerase VI subunit B